MKKFDSGDFIRYFNRSWIISPSLKRPVLVQDMDGNTVITTFRGDDGSNTIHRIPLDDLEWEHCRYPRFGYRNWKHGNRKLVVLIDKVPLRTMVKGLNATTVRITFPEGYFVGNRASIDRVNLSMDQSMAEALFEDTYPTLENAVRYMENTKGCYGMAIDSDWAITLGPTEEDCFVLHYRGCVVGKGPTVDTLTISSPYIAEGWAQWRKNHD